jgi:hypothetical protein
MKGQLDLVYSQMMESVGVEIYAEMLKMAILYPEKVKNQDISKGITEVLETITGNKVDLKAIGRGIASPSQKIIERNLAETIIVPEAQANQAAPVIIATLSPEEQALIAKQQNEFTELMRNLDAFVFFGSVPNSFKADARHMEMVRNYATIFAATTKENPGLVNYNIAGDDNFDLDMHIWDIEELGYALDKTFVLSLLQADKLPENIYDEIARKTEILNKYKGVHLYP